MRRKIMGLLFACTLSGMVLCGCGSKVATPDENGNYIVNGGFEGTDLSAWTVNNVNDVTEEINVYTRETDCLSGLQSLHFYSAGDVNFTIEQTLEGLENGTYRLCGSIQGDTAGDANSNVYMYAVSAGNEITVDADLNGYLAWNTVDISSIEVTDGKLTVGFNVTNAPGGWGTIDDITLVKE